MKGIILIAGKGNRMLPISEKIPKTLIQIGEKCLLERQIENLKQVGVKEIVLVVGFKKEIIKKFINHKFKGIKFKFIENNKYAETNTIYSLWLAKEEMNDDFFYLNGDVYFPTEVLVRLLTLKNKNTMAIDKKRCGEEEVKVICDKNGRILKIGKELNPNDCSGEFIGVAKFSIESCKIFSEKLDECIKEGKVKSFFELAVDRMLNEVEIYEVNISDIPTIEIDTLEDLGKALEIDLMKRIDE